MWHSSFYFRFNKTFLLEVKLTFLAHDEEGKDMKKLQYYFCLQLVLKNSQY